jgi:hypothetical protein
MASSVPHLGVRVTSPGVTYKMAGKEAAFSNNLLPASETEDDLTGVPRRRSPFQTGELTASVPIG